MLGIVSDEVHPDPAYAARWAAAHGMARMELRTLWGKRVPDLTAAERSALREALAGEGITVSGLSPGVGKGTLRDSDFAGQQDRLLRTMELAATLDTRKIILFGFRKGEEQPGDPDRALDVLREMTTLAHAQGFTLCLENEPGYYNGTTREILAVQTALYPLGGRLNWDPGNLFCAGEGELLAAYEKLKSTIAGVHMKDYTAQGRCVPLGRGCMPWREQLARLRRDGLTWQGRELDWNLETHCRPLEASAEESCAFARACLGIDAES